MGSADDELTRRDDNWGKTPAVLPFVRLTGDPHITSTMLRPPLITCSVQKETLSTLTLHLIREQGLNQFFISPFQIIISLSQSRCPCSFSLSYIFLQHLIVSNCAP